MANELTKEEARELVWDGLDGWSVIETKTVGHSRWSIEKEAIIYNKESGKHYSLRWSEGATEQQDEEPFEYSEPELVEVTHQEVMIKQWIPVNKGEK